MQELQKDIQRINSLRLGKIGCTDVPNQWELCKQRDICEFINGYAYSLSEIRESGYPIIRIQNLTGGNTFVHSNLDLPEKQFTEKGDLLFAWSATFGPYIWEGPKASYHYHIWKLIPTNSVNKIFLYYHLDRVSKRIKLMGQSGLGMIHMTKEGMENYPFPKPPIKEQQEIGSILSKVDELIQKTDEVIEQTQRLKKGLMQRLLTKGIGHTKFKSVALFPRYSEEIIPEGWSTDKLDDLVTIIDYRGRTPPFSDNGIPHLRSNNIRGGRLNFEDLTFVSEKTYEDYMTRGIPKGNDLLFTTEGPLGEVALVPDNFKFSIAQRIIVLRPRSGKVLSGFLKYLLLDKKVRTRYFALATGTTLGGIASKWFTKIVLPYPKDVSEQQMISNCLNRIENKISILQENQVNI